MKCYIKNNKVTDNLLIGIDGEWGYMSATKGWNSTETSPH